MNQTAPPPIWIAYLSLPLPTCPCCGREAQEYQTADGPVSHCCDVFSYYRRPMVTKRGHQLRRRAHARFDALWDPAPDEDARKALRKMAHLLLDELMGEAPPGSWREGWADQVTAKVNMGRLTEEEAERAIGLIPELREALILHPQLPAAMTEHLWRTPPTEVSPDEHTPDSSPLDRDGEGPEGPGDRA